jgi:putative ABC transport system substrate-binding protein
MQFDQLKRRDFVTLLGGAATWPLCARAQQTVGVRRIGVLYPGPEDMAKTRSVPLLEGLRNQGFSAPDQVRIELRATGGDSAATAPLLNELIASKVDILIPIGPPITRAAHSATTTIPIVTFDLDTDPVESGWLQTYAHPGGTLTGVFLDFPDFNAKLLQLLKEAVPALSGIVALWDPTTAAVQPKALLAAAQLLDIKCEILEIKTPSELDGLFEAASARRPDGLFVLSSPIASIYSKQFAELALKHRLRRFPCSTALPRRAD